MLIEIEKSEYRKHFPVPPHPYISEKFIDLNSPKVERVVRLVNDSGAATMGLVAGIRNGMLLSPFSAPFGGFHFKKENIYISEIDRFLNSLEIYATSKKLNRIELVLPPSIYAGTFNSKVINSLTRNGYHFLTPEITNWIDLTVFENRYTQKNTREYFKQAVRHGLQFSITVDKAEMKKVYDLVAQNRVSLGRKIYMTFEDILATGALWPVDFFKVTTPPGTIVASAIFYRFQSGICYAVFWGDNEEGRPLRAMDLLAFNLWSYYKEYGFRYVDLGISTECGTPNEGLLRFKESHEAVSSLRYKFIREG
jgi:hypothetical protein